MLVQCVLPLECEAGATDEDRERRAELMGCVGGEASLQFERLIQPVKHVVERHGEPAHFVMRSAQRKTVTRHMFRGDRIGSPSDVVDRVKRPARNTPIAIASRSVSGALTPISMPSSLTAT